jgi:hypothetical protein
MHTKDKLAQALTEAGAPVCRAAPARHRRRATATPNKNATNNEPRGASRAMLLKMLRGMPGFRPSSLAPPIRWTVPGLETTTSRRCF